MAQYALLYNLCVQCTCCLCISSSHTQRRPLPSVGRQWHRMHLLMRGKYESFPTSEIGLRRRAGMWWGKVISVSNESCVECEKQSLPCLDARWLSCRLFVRELRQPRYDHCLTLSAWQFLRTVIVPRGRSYNFAMKESSVDEFNVQNVPIFNHISFPGWQLPCICSQNKLSLEISRLHTWSLISHDISRVNVQFFYKSLEWLTKFQLATEEVIVSWGSR